MRDAPQAHSLEEHRRLHAKTQQLAAEAQTHGRPALALELFEEALEHAQALGDRRKVHGARINIASCLMMLGESERAGNGLAAIILESDSPLHVSAAAAQLAETLMHQGKLDKAADYLRVAGENAQQAGDRCREGWVLNVQGNLAVIRGTYDDAVDAYSRSLETFEAATREDASTPPQTVGHFRATGLDNLGYAQLLSGAHGEGLRTLRSARHLARRVGSERLVAEIEKDLSFGFLLGHRDPASERHALEALRLAERHGFPTVRQSCYYLLMELALRQSRDADFDVYFDRLQESLPGVELSREFFRIFDLSDVVNLKEF